jgi:hypothetical protein
MNGAPLVAVAALALTLGLASGCGSTREAPGDVALEFWAAVQSRDHDRARSLSTRPEARDVDGLMEKGSIHGVSLAETLSNDASALVETSLVFGADDERVSFQTHLQRLEEGWRVDAVRTARDFRRAEIVASIEELENAMREGVEAATEAIEEGLTQGAESLREALEELERSLGGRPPPI